MPVVNKSLQKISHVISAPWFHGQQKFGADTGAPVTLRLIEQLHTELTSNNINNNNLSQISHIENILLNNTHAILPQSFLKSNSLYHNALYKKRNELPQNTLIIGGDHSIAIGSVLGTLSLHKKWSDYHNQLNIMIEKEPKLHVLSGTRHEKLRKSNFQNDGINKSFQMPHKTTNINTINHPSMKHDSRIINKNFESYQLSINKNNNNKNGKELKVGVIWIDAHADINTFKTSHSGNIHGMPLSFITGLEDAWRWVRELHYLNEKLEFNDLHYWGIRDIDKFETDIIKKNNINVLNNVKDIKKIVNNYDLIHTSLDIDGIDPKWAPSTGTPVPNGLHIDDVLEYLQFIMESGKSVAIDLVEYNPEIGTEEEKVRTEDTMKQIINLLLAYY